MCFWHASIFLGVTLATLATANGFGCTDPNQSTCFSEEPSALIQLDLPITAKDQQAAAAALNSSDAMLEEGAEDTGTPKSQGVCPQHLLWKECQAVAEDIKKRFGKGNGRVRKTKCQPKNCAPRGCYQDWAGQVWHNHDKTGHCTNKRKCLCDKVVEPRAAARDVSQGSTPDDTVSLGKPQCASVIPGSELDWVIQKPCPRDRNMVDCTDVYGQAACQCEDGYQHKEIFHLPATTQCVKIVVPRGGPSPCTRELANSWMTSWPLGYKKKCEDNYDHMKSCTNGNGGISCECEEGFSRTFRGFCA